MSDLQLIFSKDDSEQKQKLKDMEKLIGKYRKMQYLNGG